MSPFDLVVDTLVFAWILYRQRRVRRVRLRFARRVPILLSVVGLLQFVHFTDSHSLSAEVLGIAIGSCLVGGAVFGALRASTVALFGLDKGVAQQATWLTIAIWLVSLGAYFATSGLVAARHGPLDVIAASTLLYLAVSMAVQNAVVHRRAIKYLMSGPGISRFRPGTVDARSWEDPRD
ncbi:MAG: hypothetical protein ACRDVW_08445 [Acidimicrobiales bacterium]